ncbi:MAG: hypothetical protein IJ091_11345 [Oscillospiraceae bacterium]|nr:hypothetical protein [Oscillospiraceae bacterium]MBQ8996394.1 hypothetical protein [Oscillospiraceae bacterium]
MATYDVGLKIGVEGDASFQKKLALITQQSKELNAEMKAVTSSFDKNDSAQSKLAATTGVLTKQIDNQRSKIDLLKQKLSEQEKELDRIGTAYQKTVEEQGKDSAAAQKLANDYATQARQVSATKTQLNNAEAALNSMNSEMEKGSKISIDYAGIMKTVGATLLSMATAAGAAAVAMGKKVVGAYGEFEQLEGGIGKIFGEDVASTVIANADKAFSTAGLSANEYLQQVTGFSASLIQSVGGDTEKAAQIADMAIRDMSDNANTFGTDVSSIQNAYQGFAKGTYNMLDNLRLGYGGTKEEMQRLLKDAQKITGIKYDISSLDDVYSAIHVIQEEVVGIANTTEKESEGTIQGSITRLKASVENLFIGMGRTGSNIDTLMENVSEAFGFVLDNITPVIERLIDYLPAVTGELIAALGEMLPTLLETVTELFNQVLETLLNMLPELMPFAVEAILTVAQTLIANLPQIVEAAIQLILSLISGIIQALPQLASMVPEIVMTIVEVILDNLPEILNAGVDLIFALLDGIITMAATLWAEVSGFIEENILEPIRQGLDEGDNLGDMLVKGIWNGISEGASWLWGKITGWAGDVMQHLSDAFGIASPSKKTAWMGKMLDQGLANGIEDNMSMVDRAWDSLEGSLGFGVNYSPMLHGATSNTFNITQLPGENGAMLARRINRQLGEVY